MGRAAHLGRSPVMPTTVGRHDVHPSSLSFFNEDPCVVTKRLGVAAVTMQGPHEPLQHAKTEERGLLHGHHRGPDVVTSGDFSWPRTLGALLRQSP